MGPQVFKFAIVGIGSTALNLVLFMGLRPSLGNQWANIVLLLICTAITTWLNRRFTFSAPGSGGVRMRVQSLALLTITVVKTSGALKLLRLFDPEANSAVSTTTVAAGNVLATIAGFMLRRRWFAPDRRPMVAQPAATAF